MTSYVLWKLHRMNVIVKLLILRKRAQTRSAVLFTVLNYDTKYKTSHMTSVATCLPGNDPECTRSLYL